MVRIAIQVKELISSNVTSLLDEVSNPAKLLAQLQREIEESLIGLTGQISKARRLQDRLSADRESARAQVDDWNDKAKAAMDNQREDLARQALLAREDCRGKIAEIERERASLDEAITEMQEAEIQLEAKREDVRTRLADQIAADGKARSNVAGDRISSRLDHIDALEKRNAYATERSEASLGNANVDREIEEMRRAQAVEEELAAMRGDT